MESEFIFHAYVRSMLRGNCYLLLRFDLHGIVSDAQVRLYYPRDSSLLVGTCKVHAIFLCITERGCVVLHFAFHFVIISNHISNPSFFCRNVRQQNTVPHRNSLIAKWMDRIQDNSLFIIMKQ